jgi:hypothetical protein
MTDDIVTRLRERADAETADGYFADPLSREAADEIERLRNAVKVRDLQIVANFKAMDAMHKELYGDAD